MRLQLQLCYNGGTTQSMLSFTKAYVQDPMDACTVISMYICVMHVKLICGTT